jgi:hypothetical protein
MDNMQVARGRSSVVDCCEDGDVPVFRRYRRVLAELNDWQLLEEFLVP